MPYICDYCDEEMHLDPNGYFVGKDETSDCDMSASGHRWHGEVGV